MVAWRSMTLPAEAECERKLLVVMKRVLGLS